MLYYKTYYFILYGMLFIFNITLYDKALADTAILNLSLMITTPATCRINDDNEVLVSFGNIQQELIDGLNYKRTPINYNLVCSDLSTNKLKMTLTWSPVYFEGISAIQTNLDNLGIAVYQDRTRLENKHDINFTYGNEPPNIYAVPIKSKSESTTEFGQFTGGMTMTLNYQ